MSRGMRFNPGNRWKAAPPTPDGAAPPPADQTVSTSKYSNKITYVDGIRFSSKKEARRWEALRAREVAGEISNLRRQVRYQLVVNGHKIGHYTADFVFQEDGQEVVEDTKGYPSRDYILRKKLMLAVHGIAIRET